MGYAKVLVPVSGKHRLIRAARALEQALQLVRADGEICFIHCVDAAPSLITDDAHRKRVMQDSGEAEKLLNPLTERVKKAAIAYSVHIIDGPPVTYIPRFASEAQCNIVVMCTDSPVKQTMGSIAARVFEFLNIPLLIVH